MLNSVDLKNSCLLFKVAKHKKQPQSSPLEDGLKGYGRSIQWNTVRTQTTKVFFTADMERSPVVVGEQSVEHYV